LQAAVLAAASAGKPVFACGKTFAEVVHVPGGVVIYGALDCNHDWVWNGDQRTTIAPLASPGTNPGGSEVALFLGPGKGTVIEDVDVVAPDGKAPGVSSIAVLADGATAVFARSDLTAGAGIDGTEGAAGNASDLAGIAGNPGIDVCNTGLTSK